MIRGAVLALVSVFFSGAALAQNAVCPTRPNGDNSNACASTAFVQTAVPLAAITSLTGPITAAGPGAAATTIGAGVVTGSNIAASTVAGSNIAPGTVANSNLANMNAGTVKSNNTGSPAAPSDNTTLPNPFSAGTSLFPTLNGFDYSATSAFGANTLGAQNILAGVPAATVACCTWLNTFLPGVDSVGRTAVYAISTPNNTSTGWTSVFAARSSDNTNATPQNIIPGNNIVVHDNATIAHQTWSGYDATYITAGAIATTHIGREISIFNNGAACGAEDPYTISPTRGCVGLRYDCAVSGALGLNPCGTAIDIVNNGTTTGAAINIASNALTGANPDALAMPNPYCISWYNAAAAKTWTMCAGTGPNGNINLTTGGTGALAVTALSETTGQAYNTSFTPVLSCGTGTITTSTSTSRYRQFGKTIHILLNLAITTLGTCATSISATLPFTAGVIGSVGSGRDTGVGGKMLSATVNAGSNSLQIFNYDNTFPAASGSNFVISIIFERN